MLAGRGKLLNFSFWGYLFALNLDMPLLKIDTGVRISHFVCLIDFKVAEIVDFASNRVVMLYMYKYIENLCSYFPWLSLKV